MITSPNDTIVVNEEEELCVLTLNRPKSLNALNREMTTALDAITQQLTRSDHIRAVIIQGAGDHFMAGGDIKAFHQWISESDDKRALKERFQSLIIEVHHSITRLAHLDQPVIGAVHGAVAGFGMSLALNCDIVLAADNSFFSTAYSQIGTSPDGGLTYNLPRVVGVKRAFELIAFGEKVDAEHALRIGLVNRVIPLSELQTESRSLAGKLAGRSSQANARMKSLLRSSLDNTLEAQLQAESIHFSECATSDNFYEGISAFLEKRPPNFK